MFAQSFTTVCTTFHHLMGANFPKWFTDYLIETRSSIDPKTNQGALPVSSWQDHSQEEIQTYLHVFQTSLAGILFNNMLSAETGYLMLWINGKNECFFKGTMEVTFSESLEAIKTAYLKEVNEQLEALTTTT